tara:strand:+ start:68 stop:295 length:228 start_codon:yes stop_codon:yes gene_type:complete
MLKKRRNNLGKYDAPLSIQFTKGLHAFRKGHLKSPYRHTTMQYREWQRGFDTAYFAQLKKVKQYESRRRSTKVYG